jgi:ribosome-associated protein
MEAEKIPKEIIFKAVTSSGPGGQHVNKTATKIEASFHINNSKFLSEKEKNLLQKKLRTRINTEGYLLLTCSETRSQHRNKAIVIKRLLSLLTENLKVAKPRKRSKPSKSSIEKRLQSKKRMAKKKVNRKKPNLE